MIQSVRGTKDILPNETGKWQYIEEKFKLVSQLFGYKELRTPVFEKTQVFNRSIGETSDIVNKEMYTFLDKGGDSVTLRPEQTAALVRSIVQNGLLSQGGIQRLWYFGPFFRYERPQKGRQRQFHQYGAECLGSEKPESDVEIILLADTMFKSLGIDDYKLMINSLGNDNSRNAYRESLIAYLRSVESMLSDDSRNRLTTNPLRILDSKDENDIKLISNAPMLNDYLDDASQAHFKKVTDTLDMLGIKYELNPKLVRGLDYYCHTVFEFQSNLLGSQDSFGGGGRYDKLVEQFGGKSTPAVGFALGVERLIIILEELGIFDKLTDNNDCYIIALGEEAVRYSQKLAVSLRNEGISVMTDLLGRSLKAQMKEANRCSAKYAIIIGQDELATSRAVVKNMIDGSQINIDFDKIIDFSFE